MSRHKEKKHRHDDDESREVHEQLEAADEGAAGEAGSGGSSPEAYEAVVSERDELKGKYQRALADYQNAQRRFTADMAASRDAGVERVLSGLIPVLDHFDLALSQQSSNVSAEQILAGVRMIRDEVHRALGGFGVATINPAPNEEFDPSSHDALSQLAVPGVEPGRVSTVYQVGYRVGDRVIRPAKVTIAPPQPTEPQPTPRVI
ncbi:MAG TPA: nucleotide exchange factor GrpE [Phycisphaerales bacterium]|nr:nucleotide exchange factor GrpE [Phycisphaerales bacterium]